MGRASSYGPRIAGMVWTGRGKFKDRPLGGVAAVEGGLRGQENIARAFGACSGLQPGLRNQVVLAGATA